jgi:pyruvate formate lyase activating enzyme
MDPELARSLLRMNQPRVLDNFRQLATRNINLIPKLSSTRG